MKYETLSELAATEIISLVDQLITHQSNNDVVNIAVVQSKIEDLTNALDCEEDFFFAPYLAEYNDR